MLAHRLNPARLLLSIIPIVVGLSLLPSPNAGAAADAAIVVLTAKGAVSPIMASYVSRGIDEAEESRASAVIIQLDTPGGLDTSMRDIVQRINSARVPVVVFVAPSGARAASAGAFITMSAHIAAMAPNTSIGAAHPVGGSGEEITGPMADKVMNDAVSYIRGIAQLRGRNADWSEKAVRESVSSDGSQALRDHVIDFVAADLADVVKQLEGKKVKLVSGEVTVTTAGRPVERVDMTIIESFLFAISDPNVAYILLSIAMLGIFLELSNPGSILPGIVGGICLLFALFALGMLPINTAGLLLIALGFVLFLAEVWITNNGMLTVGGVLALGFGSFLLTSGAAPGLRINPALIIGVVGSYAVFAAFLVNALVRTRRTPAVSGVRALIGMYGTARTAMDPEGTVMVHGELWRGHVVGGDPVPEGERVEVVGQEGMELHVKKSEETL